MLRRSRENRSWHAHTASPLPAADSATPFRRYSTAGHHPKRHTFGDAFAALRWPLPREFEPREAIVAVTSVLPPGWPGHVRLRVCAFALVLRHGGAPACAGSRASKPSLQGKTTHRRSACQPVRNVICHNHVENVNCSHAAASLHAESRTAQLASIPRPHPCLLVQAAVR